MSAGKCVARFRIIADDTFNRALFRRLEVLWRLEILWRLEGFSRRPTACGHGPGPAAAAAAERTGAVATLVGLRWIAPAGQTLALLVAQFALGFDVPLPAAFAAIGISAALNVYLFARC